MGKPIVSRRRGKGSPTFKSPSHRHGEPNTLPKLHEGDGTVEDLIHNPGHQSPLAVLRMADGSRASMLAPEGIAVGDPVAIGGEVELRVGSVLPLGRIPEGSFIFCIESKPGDGGKFVRSAGNHATVVSRSRKSVVVQLPSGRFKDFHPSCRCIIGVVAGGGLKDKPIVRAGKRFHMLRNKATYWPVVRGVAKNPVDHPFGGGQKQHTGKPKTVARGAPPGRKVGSIAAKRTGKR